MGKYAPLARLGDGGMADVFLAVARGPAGFNKLTVIKRLRNSDDSSLVRMFLDEARLSARLNHPNIVQTYEVGESQGNFFMAMEYLEGQSLQAVVKWLAERSEGLAEPVAAFVAEQVLRGLHYAHELADYDGTPLGVVHRDVSPQNLFITYRGDVKLLDFGIAKAAVNATHTETGVLKGKIRYMAPEQVAERNVDRRVDVFALGIVLWEMLARRKLFEGDSISLLNRIPREDAPLLRSVRPDVSPELEAIAAKALRRDPNERYATAEAMRIDLERFLRSKSDAETDAALARVLGEAFASTRENVRGRINAFLAMAATVDVDSPSGSGFPQAAEYLPALLADGSGPKPSPAGSGPNVLPLVSAPPAAGTVSVTNVSPRARSRRWVQVVAGGGVVVAIAVAALAIRATRPDAPTAPSAAPAAPASASVRIDTTPPGARVESNGISLGATPLSFTLAPGPQTLVLSREGYETESVPLEVTPGQSIDRALTLRPTAPPPVATAVAAPTPSVAPAAPAAPAAARPKRAATPAPSASAPARPKIRVLDDNDPP